MRLSTGISAAGRVAAGHRRSTACAALAATIALLASAGPALASSVSWSTATGVDVNGGGVMSVSCPAANQCTGIDRAGREITFDPSNPSNATTASIAGTEPLNVVSCPTTTQCTAVDGDGHEFTFDPTHPSNPTSFPVAPGNALYFVSCGGSTTRCVANARNGTVVAFDPQSPSSVSTLVTGSTSLEGLWCDSGVSQCTAIDDAGDEITFTVSPTLTLAAVKTANVASSTKLYEISCSSDALCTAVGIHGSSGEAVTFVPSTGIVETPVPTTTDPLYSVSCTSSTTCETVDNIGNAYALNPTANTVSAATNIDSNRKMHQVSCTSASQCTAVDDSGYEVTFDPASSSSTPVHIDTANGLRSIACPGASLCVGADLAGQIFTFDPNTPSPSYDPLDTNNVGFYGVSCASTSTCTAIDAAGYEYTFDPSSPGSPTGHAIHGVDTFYSIACPIAGQCTVVDETGSEYTFDASGSVTGSISSLTGAALVSVSCPTASQCTAVDRAGEAATFDPQNRKQIGSTAAIDAGNALTAVACPTIQQCTAVDGAGNQVTFDPSSPSGTVTKIDGANAIENITCPSTALCIAVDASGNAIEDDSGTWTVEPIPGLDPNAGPGALIGIACGSSTTCFAADVAGYGSLGTITPPPVIVTGQPPTISGTVAIGDTLTENHGTWTNSPTGYSYQWELCNSSGGSCGPISGAIGQTYTITAGDAGSTIAVLETASNSAGPGVAAQSTPSAVVPAPPASSTTTTSTPTTTPTTTPTAPATTTASVTAPGLTELLKRLISSKHHSAKFTFTASGSTTHYQCALVRKATGKHAKTHAPKYSLCGSTKQYKKLKAGQYTFYVRAIGPGGTGAATVYHFKIK